MLESIGGTRYERNSYALRNEPTRRYLEQSTIFAKDNMRARTKWRESLNDAVLPAS